MPNFFEKHSDTLITVATIIVAFAALVAIVDQRFNAQEKLISQRFNAVDQRFDAQDKYINQRFDAVDQRFDAVDQRFDAQDQRFDAQAQRLDRLTDEVSELRKLTVGISERVSRNEGVIDVIREQIQTADKPAPLD